jgi:hypothetical protein
MDVDGKSEHPSPLRHARPGNIGLRVAISEDGILNGRG